MSAPLTRMMLYMGMKLETHENCYGQPQEDGSIAWKTEFAKTEHATMTEIHKTLELVAMCETEFKQILKRKLGSRKPEQK